MPRRAKVIPLVALAIGLHLSATAQWTQQTIRLQPGWNAIFLEVQPQPRDCDTVFRGLPIESVWGWNRRFTSIQFVQDPTTLVPEQPEWLTYFPPASPQSFLTNLFLVQGGRAYLVKLSGTQAKDLVLRGQPSIRQTQWMSDSYNFVGFHADAAAPPTFAAFFAPSTAHAGQDVFRISSAGRWQKVANPATDRMRRGEAYWVYCRGTSTYQGPLCALVEGADGMEFGRLLIEQTLTLKNASASARTITLRLSASGQPPVAALPALAGAVPLSFFENDVPHKKYGWSPLPSPFTLTVGAGSEATVRFAVRRAAMAPFTPPLGREALYQSLIELKDGAGSQLLIPVSARGLDAPLLPSPMTSPSPPGRGSAAEGPTKFANPATPHIRAGLWVGTVTIDAVSNPTSGSLEPTRPLPTASPFAFRLIVHVDSTGQARLLQQVLQMWKEGAWVSNPADPTSKTFILDPNSPGRTVLLTDDSLIPRFSGFALRDVKLVGRRISSAVFGFRDPIPMGGGAFGVTSGAPTTCTVTLDYQDPTNPFRHKYHPDHDNLNERYEQVLPEGRESYTVVREIALQFTAQDPEDLVSARWGDSELGGVYTERLLGVHRSAVDVSGTFRLQRVTDVGVLNDGLR